MVHSRTPAQNVVTSEPFQLISIDFVLLEKCASGYEYILVVINHFIHFAQAYATTKNLLGQLQRNFLTISFNVLVSRAEYIMTKAPNLKIAISIT